jgi:hypothetical protein
MSAPPQLNPEMLGNQAWQEAEQDSRMIKANSAWSSCMSRRGLHYGKPNDANEDPRWQGGPASPAEIETAKADVGCKEEVNLVGTWYALEVAYQKRLVERNFTQLEALKRYEEMVAKNAAKVVAG